MHSCSHPSLEDLVSQAQARTGVARAKLTEPRRQVLELLLHADQPLKAYELLEQMQRDRGAKVDPPTVYRALEFLVDIGLAHRLDSLNAYRACAHLDINATHVFLVCKNCSNVEELPTTAVAANLKALAEAAGFSTEDLHIELRGRCKQCLA
jgi:Fur family transcriptional regulator, zinc uptake regulator